MIDIAVTELNKYYGANHVLKGMSFEVFAGERVGLLGKNGSGKTTLFKVITGEEPFESGSVAKASRKRIEVLSQIPVFEETETVEDSLRSSFRETAALWAGMQQLEGNPDPQALARYGQLMEEYERLGGYRTEVQLDKVCSGMGIDAPMRQSLFCNLSGGEKTRVNLARILLRDCDILLLDEPTNHLDLLSLDWLERFLRDFAGTVVIVSHDRVFLDNVVTRIIEIENGKANFYSGNYSFYLAEREQRYLTQLEQHTQQQRKINQLEAAIKRQRVWMQINPANTGLAKRAQAMEKRIEQMDKVEKPTVDRKLTAGFDSGGYSSKEVVVLDSVQKSYGAKTLLRDVSIKLYRDDRVALVGANGCGKTALIKMLMQEESCDGGTIKMSPNVKPAYMPQVITFPQENATILDTLRTAVQTTEQRARNILAGFHFRAEDVMKKVGTLSGGERSRLKLCLLMQNDTNFLLLDEPTNHLDIASREWIEDALTQFEGTMLFVSHDRYFLHKFARKIWSMGDGAVTEHDGGFEEYQKATAPVDPPKSKPKAKTPPPKQKPKPRQPPPVSVEELIAETERLLKQVDEEIAAELQSCDYQKADALYEKRSRLEEKTDYLYAQWMQDN